MSRLLKDYSLKRAVIETCRFVYKSQIKDTIENRLYIKVPQKIRRELKLSNYNEKEFRVIIVRKNVQAN